MGRGQVDGLKTLARRASSLAAVLALAVLCFAAECSADAGVLEAARARGHLVCGVPDGPAGYSKLDRRWRMDRHRRGLLQGSRCRRPRQQGCGQVPGGAPERPLRNASIGRHRCADRRGCPGLAPRNGARHPLSRRTCLRGPGLHGAQVAWRRQCAGAVGRARLRDGPDRGRRGRRRLFRGAQDAVRDRQARQVAGGGRGLRQQELPGPVRRYLRAGAGASAIGRARQAHDPARGRKPGS